jgi:uncharacterized protein YecE (DUF72 family)
MHPLAAYSKAFNFVEVNSTFYQMPPLKDVKTWRRLVPPDFQFAVRANRKITLDLMLGQTDKAFKRFEEMTQICEVLTTNILHLQIPASFSNCQTSVGKLRHFLSSLNLRKIRLVLELRGTPASKISPELVKTMRDYNIVHCVDLSKGEKPAYETDMLYSRLFGKGVYNKYQPTDEELIEIDEKALSKSPQKIILSFHFVKMYKDAARLKIYKQTGRFPKITKSTGLLSFAEVLMEDAKFPASKQDLIRGQGWKLFDLTEDKRTRMSEYLQRLPEKAYNNVSDVLFALRSLVK